MKKLFSALKKGSFFLPLAFMTMPVFSQSKLLVGSWRLTADGHYVVEIFRSDRIKFASGDRAKGTITFHIERASYPNWDETTRVSSFTLEGDKLAWRAAPRPDGSIPVSVFSRMP